MQSEASGVSYVGAGDRTGTTIAIVGAGRVGRALAAALPDAFGPFGRGFDGRFTDVRTGVDVVADVVILAVPDGQIGAAADAVSPGPLVGHCSGATTLAPLAPHAAFSVHPLMTITGPGATFAGASAAVAGSTPAALAMAHQLAARLGLRAIEIDDRNRVAYHAAACVAANFLVTLEDAAERLIVSAGGDRNMLVPLVEAAVANWAELGGSSALTGPIARGDEDVVAAHRAAIAARAPDLITVFDAMADATRRLAASRAESPGGD